MINASGHLAEKVIGEFAKNGFAEGDIKFCVHLACSTWDSCATWR